MYRTEFDAINWGDKQKIDNNKNARYIETNAERKA